MDINKAIYKAKKYDRTLKNQANFNSYMQNLPQNPVVNYKDPQIPAYSQSFVQQTPRKIN